MAAPAKEAERYTYADYLTWDDDVRRELIDGEIFVMSPAPRRIHQSLLLAMASQVQTKFEESDGPCEVYMAPFDVRLSDEADADDGETTVVQPDLVVFCDDAKLDDKGARGAPEWVVEVLSPSTASHDQIRKRDLYERHGVAEYWLVHPQDRVAWIYRLNSDGEYDSADIVECTASSSVRAVPGLGIDWDRAFSRVPREV